MNEQRRVDRFVVSFVLFALNAFAMGCANAPTPKETPVPVPPADAATLTGFVVSDSGTVEFANVMVLGTRRGAVADEKGRFVITMVPPGPQKIRSQSPGFDVGTDSLIVEAGKVIDVGTVKLGKRKVVKLVLD